MNNNVILTALTDLGEILVGVGNIQKGYAYSLFRMKDSCEITTFSNGRSEVYSLKNTSWSKVGMGGVHMSGHEPIPYKGEIIDRKVCPIELWKQDLSWENIPTERGYLESLGYWAVDSVIEILSDLNYQEGHSHTVPAYYCEQKDDAEKLAKYLNKKYFESWGGLDEEDMRWGFWIYKNKTQKI